MVCGVRRGHVVLCTPGATSTTGEWDIVVTEILELHVFLLQNKDSNACQDGVFWGFKIMLAKCPLQVWLTVSAQLSLRLFLVSIARWSFPKRKNYLLVSPLFVCLFFPYWIIILQKLFSIEKSSRVPFNIFKVTYRKKLFLKYRQVWKETVKIVICLFIQHPLTKYCKHKNENDPTLYSRLM